ncbi:MAG: hypothetical protein ACE14T_11950 [Syntrophales bacterium]
MLLTFENAHKYHVELWNWLAETGSRGKDDWPRWDFNGGDMSDIESLCFACEFCNDECGNCPIEWGGNDCMQGGLYVEWLHADEKKRTELAAQIRDLPWREK